MPEAYIIDAIRTPIGRKKGSLAHLHPADLGAHPQVAGIHDLHVWALASRTPAMTAHVVVADGSDPAVVRQELAGLLARHGVSHVTLQMERPGEAACAGGRCGHP